MPTNHVPHWAAVKLLLHYGQVPGCRRRGCVLFSCWLILSLAYSSLYHEQGVVNLTLQHSPLLTPPPGKWHHCRSGPFSLHKIPLFAAGAELETTLSFSCKKKKNPSSLLKAFVLCEERGWGAVGWRLLFSICTRWCFGLEGKQGFQNNGDWLLLLVFFFFLLRAGNQPQNSYSSSCKYQQH